MHDARALPLLAISLLVGCAGREPSANEAPVVAVAPLATAPSPPQAPPVVPLAPNVTLAHGASVMLADGAMLSVEGIEVESIAASPDNPAAYPGGSGVTVRLMLAGQPLSLTRLSEGYRSSAVGWAFERRIELIDSDGKVARLAVHRVVDRVLASQPLRIRRGERVRLFEAVDFHFLGHTHKRTMGGDESPLMVVVDYHDGRGQPETASIYPPKVASWSRQDLRFTLGEYAYDDFMELVVDRLALEPLPPAR